MQASNHYIRFSTTSGGSFMLNFLYRTLISFKVKCSIIEFFRSRKSFIEAILSPCINFKSSKIFLIVLPFPKVSGFDLFLNSASFGEMERDVVKNYLSYIRGNANKIFLLNARSGKETTGENTVDRPIKFDDYCEYLTGYMLLGEEDAHYAHKKMDMSGGYFQAVWELSSSRNV